MLSEVSFTSLSAWRFMTDHVSPVETHTAHPPAPGEVQEVAHAGNHMAHGDTQGGRPEAHPMIHAAQAGEHGVSQDHEAYEYRVSGAGPAGHTAEHGAHVDHTAHEQMFRRRFWVSLILSVPVLLYSSIVAAGTDSNGSCCCNKGLIMTEASGSQETSRTQARYDRMEMLAERHFGPMRQKLRSLISNGNVLDDSRMESGVGTGKNSSYYRAEAEVTGTRCVSAVA